MNGYLAKRLVGAIPTLVGVSLLTFLFIRLLPGDAIAARLGTSTALSPEQLASLRAYFGLDQPLHLQYWSWLTSLFRGDAGYSIRTGRPVLVEIAERRPDRSLTSELLARDAHHRPVLVVSSLATEYRRLRRLRARPVRQPEAAAPARHHARSGARGRDDAHDALGHARRARRRLRPHGESEGLAPSGRVASSRPEERAHRGGHAARDPGGSAPRRRGRRRGDLLRPRCRPHAAHRHRATRLRARSGRSPRDRDPLRGAQHLCGSAVWLPGSPNPPRVTRPRRSVWAGPACSRRSRASLSPSWASRWSRSSPRSRSAWVSSRSA